MTELTAAPAIATPEDGDILPIRKAGVAGLLKITLAQVKAYLNLGSAAGKTYTEGTFVPILTFGGNSNGIVYGNQIARYTKIGRAVFVELRLTITSKGTSTGAASIKGLPFPQTAGQPTPAFGFTFSSGQNVGIPQCLIAPGASTVDLISAGSSTIVALNDSYFAQNTDILISFFYTAAN